MTDHLSDLMPFATELAIRAGKILRDGQNTVSASVLTTKSSPVDIVTELDHESENLIVGEIRARYPDDGVLGEEGSAFDGTTGRRWVIDPLDGTVNFTYGLPRYAVSIGLEVDGVARLGVVYSPATDELFSALEGAGAFHNGEQIFVREPVDLSSALVATGFSYLSEERKTQAEILGRVLPRVRDIRRFGSAALDMCSVAGGNIDAYYERGAKRWDFCGGEVIAREAGATVTSLEGTTPVDSVLVAGPQLYPRLLELIVDTPLV